MVSVASDGGLLWREQRFSSLSAVARATADKLVGSGLLRRGERGMSKLRCAIYTRKSSEEGLVQNFNSLHAQREACEAYIKSQASEGWTLIRTAYDDGGLSGGTLDQPALKTLMADIAARRIDIVVVYKVDRLTRSLFDFANLIEDFDAAGVSFVSVTQAFNTTTSMGRLTLNMLLSFAQFEREVTAERIRDKLAQSKARGMRMGGVPPLGYAPNGRSLKIVAGRAAIVGHVFDLYRALGTVRQVEARLMIEGVRKPLRTMLASGRAFDGTQFTRGELYKLLANPIYVDEIAYRGQRYPGQHHPIIDRDIWNTVQARLATNAHQHRAQTNAHDPSLLAGKVFDDVGELLVATHATKRGKRDRYYVSRSLQHGTKISGATGIRVPAAELEPVIAAQLAAVFADPIGLCTRTGATIDPDRVGALVARGGELAAQLRVGNRAETVRASVARIDLHPERIAITVEPGAVLDALGLGSIVRRATQDRCHGAAPTQRPCAAHRHRRRHADATAPARSDARARAPTRASLVGDAAGRSDAQARAARPGRAAVALLRHPHAQACLPRPRDRRTHPRRVAAGRTQYPAADHLRSAAGVGRAARPSRRLTELLNGRNPHYEHGRGRKPPRVARHTRK